jgi:multimeric flavodoxin WrbA
MNTETHGSINQNRKEGHIMKVLALNGSPNKGGNTYQALQIAAKELENQNIGVETITIGDKRFQGCIGCYGCRVKGQCVLPDTEFSEIVEKIFSADGVLLGSPVYYGGINGTMKSFLDRVFFSAGGKMRYKVGASVVALRRSGAMSAFEQLNNYMMASEMMIVPSCWNIIFGAQPGEIQEDKEGIWRLRKLGSNMAWMLKMKELAKDNLTSPIQEERISTNFIR